MKLSSLLVPVCLSTGAAGAFVGLGGAYQRPNCAYGCGNAFTSVNLTCTELPMAGMGMGMGMAMTSPACKASNEPYLTSIAYCMKQKCESAPVWQLEQYWATMITGSPTVMPKWDYHTTLDHVGPAPTVQYMPGVTVNSTMLVNEKSWTIQNHFAAVMDHNSVLLYRYA
jgi:hypothetical protein